MEGKPVTAAEYAQAYSLTPAQGQNRVSEMCIRDRANIYRLPDYIETRDLETLWTCLLYTSRCV